MALSSAYLRAAAEKREPVIVVRVDNPDTTRIDYATQADWAGSATLTDIDTDEVVGSAKHGTTAATASQYAGDILTRSKDQAIFDVPFDGWLTSIDARVYWFTGDPNQIQMRLLVKVGSEFSWPWDSSDADYVSEWTAVTATNSVSTAWYGDKKFIVSPSTTSDSFLSTDTLYVAVEIESGYLQPSLAIDETGYTVIASSAYFCDNAATLTTSTIDFGATLATPPTIAIDDIRASGSGITYTTFGGNADPPATNLGTVADGDTVGAVGYRYYRLQADFTTTNGARASVSEISLIGGAPSTVALSTHRGVPDASVWPIIPADAVGTLSSKIELDKPTSVGEVSFRCLWTRAMGDLLYNGDLRNKAVTIKHGFVGLSETEYATIFVGTWANFKADHKKRLITVSTQNALRRFMAVKIPRETFASNGTKSTTSFVKTAANAVQVILDLLDELGIPDRYIDRTTLEGLRDGALSGPEYDVTRTISTPTEVWKLVHELATICGGWIAVTGEGRITLRLYSEDAVDSSILDARYVDFGSLDGGQDDLYTRQLIYYDPNTANPGESDSDYDKGYLYINAASETAYGDSREQRWYEKWNASKTLVEALANRRDRWAGSPRLRFSASNVPMRFAELVEGQTVRVDRLVVPCDTDNYDSNSQMTALILKRGFNPSKCTLDFDLLQLSEAYPGFTTGFSLGFRS